MTNVASGDYSSVGGAPPSPKMHCKAGRVALPHITEIIAPLSRGSCCAILISVACGTQKTSDHISQPSTTKRSRPGGQ
jgi:hypothetical protein